MSVVEYITEVIKKLIWSGHLVIREEEPIIKHGRKLLNEHHRVERVSWRDRLQVELQIIEITMEDALDRNN